MTTPLFPAFVSTLGFAATAVAASPIFHWQSISAVSAALTHGEPPAEVRSGDLAQQMDEIKLSLRNQGRILKDVTRDELDSLLAKKRGQTVEELRAYLAEASKSADAFTRAEALIASDRMEEGLKALEDITAQSIRLHRLRARVFEAQSKKNEALSERQAVAALIDQEKAPVAWADAQHMVAYCFNALGDKQAAETSLRAVLAVRVREQYAEHPDTLATRSNLAIALQAQGRRIAAEEEHRVVLGMREHTLGPEHPDTLAARLLVAGVLLDGRKNAEAEADYRALLSIMKRVLGPEHRNTILCGNNLAVALGAQGKHAEAEAEHRTLLAIRERLLGPEHRDTLGSRTSLASALGGQGKYAEAETEDRAVLAIRERTLGLEHPDTLESRMSLAISLGEQKKWAEALTEAQLALDGRRKVLGERNPYTRSAGQFIEKIRLRQAESEKK